MGAGGRQGQLGHARGPGQEDVETVHAAGFTLSAPRRVLMRGNQNDFPAEPESLPGCAGSHVYVAMHHE
jgi:hypothetical protein